MEIDAEVGDSASVELGQSDLEIVEDERRFNDDGTCDIILKVTNLTDTLSGGKVCIYNDPYRQTVIGEESFGKLGKGESDYITFHTSAKELAITDTGVTAVQAAVISAVTDYRASNDISSIIIESDSFIGSEETPEDNKSLESCEALLDKQTYAYSGAPVIPKLTVKDGDNVLTAGKDYTAEFKDNTDRGTASVIINGIGDYSGMLTKSFKIVKPSFRYRAYVQKKSWVPWQEALISGTKASGIAGTTDNLRMETIQMQLSGIGGEVKYRAYVQKKGWTQWATTADKSTYAGTKGLSLRTELIQLKTSGKIDSLYDIYYRAYCEKLGWLGWASNNQKAGTQGYAYMLEAFQVNLVPKGTAFKLAKSSTRKTFYDKTKDGADPR